MAEIKIALLSAYDKTGIENLGALLTDAGYMILSTGGTYRALVEGFEAMSGDRKNQLLEVSEYTGTPESPGGLFKTLNKEVHGGFLMSTRDPVEFAYMMKEGIFPIDFAAVNLYPFKETIEKGGFTHQEAVEKIDIGGPTMLRSAAKGMLRNERPIIVVDPEDYTLAFNLLRSPNEKTSLDLARKVFAHTKSYDATIEGYLEKLGGE